jgi:hypothetical protein
MSCMNRGLQAPSPEMQYPVAPDAAAPCCEDCGGTRIPELEWGAMMAPAGVSEFWHTAYAVDAFQRSSASAGEFRGVVDAISQTNSMLCAFRGAPVARGDVRAHPTSVAEVGAEAAADVFGGRASLDLGWLPGGGWQPPPPPPLPDKTPPGKEYPVLGPPVRPPPVVGCCCYLQQLEWGVVLKDPRNRKTPLVWIEVQIRWKEVPGKNVWAPCGMTWSERSNYGNTVPSVGGPGATKVGEGWTRIPQANIEDSGAFNTGAGRKKWSEASPPTKTAAGSMRGHCPTGGTVLIQDFPLMPSGSWLQIHATFSSGCRSASGRGATVRATVTTNKSGEYFVQPDDTGKGSADGTKNRVHEPKWSQDANRDRATR